MIDKNDWREIEERFDNRYVMQCDCSEQQLSISKKFANDDKRIEIITHDFDMIKKLMWAIATASIGSLIAAIFELILR